MNKYKKQVKAITKDKTTSDAEKIEALRNLLAGLETKYTKLDTELNSNLLDKTNKRLSFYEKQMIISVIAGLVTMATATKSLEINSLLNNILLAVSGSVTALGFGGMALEELGAPLFKEDFMMIDCNKISAAKKQIEELLEQMQPQTEPQR